MFNLRDIYSSERERKRDTQRQRETERDRERQTETERAPPPSFSVMTEWNLGKNEKLAFQDALKIHFQRFFVLSLFVHVIPNELNGESINLLM